MSEKAKHFYVILFFVFAVFVVWRMTEKEPVSTNFVKTEVDSVKFIPPVQAVNNNYPTRIIYQTIIDTTRRKEAEKDTIITGVKINGNVVTIQKINPDGRVTEEVHKIEEGSKVVIDNKGFEEKKKTKVGKILKKAKKVVLRTLQVAGAVAIVYAVAK